MVQPEYLNQPGINSQSSFTLHSLSQPWYVCQDHNWFPYPPVSTLSVMGAVDKLIVLEWIITVPVIAIHFHPP